MARNVAAIIVVGAGVKGKKTSILLKLKTLLLQSSSLHPPKFDVTKATLRLSYSLWVLFIENIPLNIKQ